MVNEFAEEGHSNKDCILLLIFLKTLMNKFALGRNELHLLHLLDILQPPLPR